MLRSVVSCRRLPAARTAIALVGLCAVGAPVAQAAKYPVELGVPQLSRTTLSGPGISSTYEPSTDVAANDRGDAVAAWTITPDTPAGAAGNTMVQVAFRAAGGPWSAPATISDLAYGASAPSVGIDAQGTATVSWGEAKGINADFTSRLRVTTHSAAGFGATQDFAAEDEMQSLPSLAVSPAGSAVLTYTATRSAAAAAGKARSVLKVAQRTSPAGTFGPSQTLSSDVADTEIGWGGSRHGAPVAAINATGTAAVVWEEVLGTDPATQTGRIRLARGPVGSLGSAVDLTASTLPGVPYNPQVVVAADGVITASWAQDLGGSNPYIGPVDLVVRRVAADGTAGAPQTLGANAAGDDAYHYEAAVELGVDGAGGVTAAWAFPAPVFPDYSPANILAATAPASGGFGAPQTIADVHGTFSPSLAVDSNGAAAVSWGGRGKFLIVARRPAGASTFGQGVKRTDPWVTEISSAFGRPDELTLVFGTVLPDAQGYLVDSITTNLIGTGVEPATADPDTVKPVVSVKQVSVVKAARKKGKKQAGRLVATLDASEPVSVRAVVSQARKGIKRGGQCVKRPSNPKLRKGKKKCTRTVVIGPEVGAPVSPDGSTLDLGVAPPNGTYKLTVKPRDAAGNVGETVTFSFNLG